MSEAPDRAMVRALLRRHVDERAECTAVTRAPVGNSQETWFVDVAGLEAPLSLVLRRTAAGGTIEWTDRATEVEVLAATAAGGLPVPKVWWWEPDGGALDRAYVVMDRAPGGPPDLRQADVRTELALDLGIWLARLHRSVSIPARLQPTRPTTTTASREQVELWTERSEHSGLAPAIASALCGWLAANVPDDGTDAVLLWGDPGPHNVLTDPTGRITALLDWELAHSGHPLFDVGAARWSCLGHLDRDALTTAYEQEAGVEIDRRTLGWFEVLACVSRSVMLFDGVRAAIAGRAHDPNVVGLAAAMVPANMLRAAAIAWGISSADGVDGADGAERHGELGWGASRDQRDGVLARFLTDDVLATVTDARVRRGLKVAAALLDPQDGAPPPVPADHRSWYRRELTGTNTDAARRDLVADMVVARHRHGALVDLYGPTAAV